MFMVFLGYIDVQESSQYIKIFRADMKTIPEMTPMLPTPDQWQCGAVWLTVERCWRRSWPLQKMSSVADNLLGAIICGEPNLHGKPGVTNQPRALCWRSPVRDNVPCVRGRPCLCAFTVRRPDCWCHKWCSVKTSVLLSCSLQVLSCTSVKGVYSVKMSMVNIAEGGGTVMTTL